MLHLDIVPEYFDFIYTKDDVQNIKPNPEVYYRILEDYNANIDDCLIIEDSLIGVDTHAKLHVQLH